MHIKSSELPSLYNKLLLLTHSQSCGVVVFVSCLDLDSINAAKMLSLILKKDLVQLQIIPVTGYTNLKDQFLKLDDSSKIVILIGCGGMLNLLDYLPEGDDFDDDEENSQERDVSCVTERSIYVFDSHRPWDLQNLFGNENIYCVDDNEDAFSDLEDIKQVYYTYLEMEDDPELDSDNDEEDADLYDNMGDQDAFNELEDEEEEGEANPLKRKITEKAIARRNIKRKRTEFSLVQRKIDQYYQQGTFVDTCLSRTMYLLSKKLGYANLQTTWLYITGVVSLERSAPHVAYNLKSELVKETNLMTHLTNNDMNKSGKESSEKAADLFKINYETDYHLFLLRQTSLLDSFLLSNYCNAKMQLWHDTGRKKLNSMFARMGISLVESQKNWLYLSSNIKQRLGQIMEDNLPFYGLKDLLKKGFVKNNGFRNSCSANDFVEAILALLEINIKTGISEDLMKNQDRKNGEDSENYTPERDELEEEEVPIDDMLVERSKKWVENFWQCWDCLNEDLNQNLLKKGLIFSSLLQKQIVNRGKQYIESRSIKHMKHFRLCVLKEGNDLQLYKHPLTLLRLGDWLLECCCESSDDKTLLPMVIAAFDPKTNTYLCAGIAPKYPLGMILANPKKGPIPNRFGNAFRAVARSTNATVRMESFDSTLIEVKREDFLPFLETFSLSGLLSEK